MYGCQWMVLYFVFIEESVVDEEMVGINGVVVFWECWIYQNSVFVKLFGKCFCYWVNVILVGGIKCGVYFENDLVVVLICQLFISFESLFNGVFWSYCLCFQVDDVGFVGNWVVCFWCVDQLNSRYFGFGEYQGNVGSVCKIICNNFKFYF